jgi:phage tail sheath gpL-like
MPNTITGKTDTTGAVSAMPGRAKIVCIVASRGTGFTATEEVVFDVVGTADAAKQWGADSPAVELVRILISKGVSSIKGIMTKAVGGELATKAATYEEAFSKLLVENVDIIILDELDSTVTAKLGAHLSVAEAEDILRYGCVGAAVAQSNTQLASVASAINNKRIFMPGPNTCGSNAVAQSGIYAAAGLAALIATETTDPALPMDGVEMIGFGGVERVLLKAEKDTLVAAGVTPLYTSPSGNPTIFRLVTTYTKDTQSANDPTWQEGTTVFIADDVLSSVMNRLRANYKRTKNVPRILSSIRTDVIDVLQSKNDLEIIENFDPKTVTVAKDPSDVYGALIDYEFDVVTPLYTLSIKQHMKL